jgi:hypothetical protein
MDRIARILVHHPKPVLAVTALCTLLVIPLLSPRAGLTATIEGDQRP